MAEQHDEEDCIRTFQSGNEHDAEQLLQHITRAAVFRTTRFTLRVGGLAVALVSFLHAAAVHGWLKVVSALTTKYNCDANLKDDEGRTPLHYAAYNGHLEVVKYFTTKARCHPMTTNNNGNTPLHHACVKGHLHITEYLVSELQCDSSTVNKYGCTPLHYACDYGHAHIVQYLLSTGQVNPLSEDKNGFTPVDYARDSENSYNILKLFHPFEQCKKDFPVHTFTKLILTGYSGAGKSTVAQLVVLLTSKGTSSDIAAGCVAEVQRLTAGIIPIHVESGVKEVSNMVMYDFAGQQEYYSSHAAILEHVMQRSAAIFICMVDLSQSKGEICESVQYWLSFVENACSTAEGMSHVVIIGSHADLVNSSQELEEKSSLVQKIADSKIKQLSYEGFVRMDCRRSDTDDAHHLVSLLSNSQQAIIASQPSMSFYCHVLYAFLRTKLKKTGCTLQELTSALTIENDPSLPSNPAVLSEFLMTLNDKGLILFVKNKEHPLSSWVVVKKEALLREINGTLFAPEHFKEHREIASNTGIVLHGTLHETFPHHDTEMIIGFLQSLEICQPVDSSTLQDTNLNSNRPTSSFPTATNKHLFFPGLVKECRPDNLTPMKFGWCLGCREPYQFFSSRFLHVLVLRLAFTFSLASQHLPPSSSLHGLQRRCQVWRNGISWQDVSGVSTVVEILDQNRWAVVLVSERHRRAAETCSKVIRMILDLHQELCKAVEVCNCLISPSLLDCYPFTILPDTDLFDMRDVARSMVLRHEFILDRKEGSKRLRTEEAVPFEPYYLLSPSSVCQLFNSSMAKQPVPAPLLQEIRRHCHLPQLNPQNHRELRECVNRLSIFTGRNPLEVAELKEEDIISHTAGTELPPGSPGVTDDPSRTLIIDDLFELKMFMKDLVDWQSLGLALGLRYPTLKVIAKEKHGDIGDCKIEMLAAWLQQQDNVPQKGVPSWSVLQAALRRMGENELADKIIF